MILNNYSRITPTNLPLFQHQKLDGIPYFYNLKHICGIGNVANGTTLLVEQYWFPSALYKFKSNLSRCF